MPRVYGEQSFIRNKLSVNVSKKAKGIFVGELINPTRSGDVINFNFSLDVAELSLDIKFSKSSPKISTKQSTILVNNVLNKITEEFNILKGIPFKSFNITFNQDLLSERKADSGVVKEKTSKEKVVKEKTIKEVKEKVTKEKPAVKEKPETKKAEKVTKEKATKEEPVKYAKKPETKKAEKTSSKKERKPVA